MALLTLKDLISSARRTKKTSIYYNLKRAITDLVHSKYVAIKIENKRHMLAFKRFACYEIYWSGKKVNRYIILLASQILAIAKRKYIGINFCNTYHIFASETQLRLLYCNKLFIYLYLDFTTF